MLKSVSGLGLYVSDIKKTVAFYKKLGFNKVSKDEGSTKIYLNWFWVQFTENATSKNLGKEFQKEAFAKNRGAGLYINVSVSEIDAYYSSLLKKRLKPSSKPRNWPWGNREFVIRDPDGYKIVFFEKIK